MRPYISARSARMCAGSPWRRMASAMSPYDLSGDSDSWQPKSVSALIMWRRRSLPSSAYSRSNRRISITVLSWMSSVRTSGTASPASLARRSVAVSSTGIFNRSLTDGNLASQRCPASSVTDALGRMPPMPLPASKMSCSAIGTGSPSSIRSAASSRYSSRWTPVALAGGDWMSGRMSSAPAR